MASNDGPLPTPPRSRFGRNVHADEQATAPLTADRLAQAAAEGQLEDFLQHGIPEGEHARHLTMMMLGMSGMMPPGAMPPGAPPAPSEAAAGDVDPAGAAALPGGTGAAVPPEVQAAVMQADVVGLMSLLQAEHARRSGEGAAGGVAPAAPALAASGDAGGQGAAPQQMHAGPGARVGFDQALVDEMIRVAADNQVSVDWLLLRAVKLYLEEHRRTGRL